MRAGENGQEDVMTEAVSLLERIEIRCPNRQDPIVLGIIPQGWLFVYFGSDTMYRFDELGRLRRAFVDGYLYRTEGRTLAQLERQSSRNTPASSIRKESNLVRRDLSPEDLKRFEARTKNDLHEASSGLIEGQITRQHPSNVEGLAMKFHDAIMAVLQAPQFLAPAIVRR